VYWKTWLLLALLFAPLLALAIAPLDARLQFINTRKLTHTNAVG
jgi:hypothetical protein